MNLKKILLFLNILLAGLVLWTAFNIYETWASYKNMEKRPITAALETERTEKADQKKLKKRNDYRIIVSRDIFKTKATPSKAKEKPGQKPKLEELKENTRFELMGTIVGEGGNSFAIIREKNKKEQDIYALNDYVEDAKIEKILSDRVIVERAGTEEVLVISHERGAAPRSSMSVKRKVVSPPTTRKAVRKRPVRPRIRPVRRPAKPDGPGESD